MQTTISFTDQDDKAAVADLLARIASALSSTSDTPVLSHVQREDHGDKATEAPATETPTAKATRTRSKKPDPVETYNALAAAAGAPAVTVEQAQVALDAVTAANAAAVAAIDETARPVDPTAPVVTPEPPAEDRKALEASVLAALNKAGMAWARANWPAGKPLRLGDFSNAELLDLRTKAEGSAR